MHHENNNKIEVSRVRQKHKHYSGLVHASPAVPAHSGRRLSTLPLSCALASFFRTRAVSQSFIRYSCGARVYMWLKCIIKVLRVANSIEKLACTQEQRTMCGCVFDALISAVWLVASLIEFCWSAAMQIHPAVGDARAL